MHREARDLLDKLVEKYRQEHNGKEIRDINGYRALYWAIRYSDLINPCYIETLGVEE